jgi:hypothetical protein
MRTKVLGVALAGGTATLLSLMARGRLTLDTGWGRTVTSLGPISVTIDAPRELVFDFIASPYLGRAPREVREHLDVWERGADMVIAAHRSRVAGYVAETVEAVRFERPDRVTFRHLRGPVPHAAESFELSEHGDGTTLVYRGEVGIDFWVLGAAAARFWVVPTWERVVRESLASTKEGAERLATARARRG